MQQIEKICKIFEIKNVIWIDDIDCCHQFYYLMIHLTHLYDRHTVKDHLDNKRGFLLLFPARIFYMQHPTDRIMSLVKITSTRWTCRYPVFKQISTKQNVAA